ncbi:ras and EF-hand domain-containing protein isoform X2 [Protopterus annectens]|nr:ras and EF-hand domain-containing protein isoform X2 [Protopterus annectens]
MEEEEEFSRLQQLFHACDSNGSGFIEKEEFVKLCADLQLRSPAEVDALFLRLDLDRDGAINFHEFARGFLGVSSMLAGEFDLPDGGQAIDGGGQAWDDFINYSLNKDEARHIPRPEHVSTLYQNILTVEPRLLYQYERVIKNFVREIKLQNLQMENLALAVKRAQDKAAIQLSELEDEMEQRIQMAENTVRKEEKRKAEEALTDLKRQYEAEVCELQVTIKKLKTLEEQYKTISPKEDVVELKRKIHILTQENQNLKKDLLESQSNIGVLQSELDALKSEYANRCFIFEREQDIIRGYTDETESLARQVEMLQSANRKLHDSNDGLRTTLENSFSKHNRSLCVQNTSPASTLSRSSPKLGGHHSPQAAFFDRSPHFPIIDDDYESLALCDPIMCRISCEVESLNESCFDSGLSTLRDSNDCDSDTEYRHPRNYKIPHSMQDNYGGDASDTDVSEIRDDETYIPESSSALSEWSSSQTVVHSNSGASARKCISAISPQADKTDNDFKYPSSGKSYKIVLAGDAAVGKSSFMLRLCKNEFRGNTSATLGVDFQMKTLVVDGEPTVLQLWDTAGQERFRSIAKSYFRRADGVLLLYDVTCERSFVNIREWVDTIEDVSETSIPIMLVGNKADMRLKSSETQKCVPTSYGEKLAMTYNALFCETSAKEGSNVVEAVLHLAR